MPSLSAYGPDGTHAHVPLPQTPQGAGNLPGGPLQAAPAAATVPVPGNPAGHAEQAGQGQGEVGSMRDADLVAANPNAGTKYDGSKPRLDLIPAPLLLELAALFEMGARKYAPRNWEAGFEWHRNYNGAMRHLLRWWSGEENDPEDGQPHLISAIWNLIVLRHFERTGNGTDDRPDHGPLP